MTSVEKKIQNTDGNGFVTPAEPSGLVDAFLELDEGSLGSDDEFLDFQFRIADANANRQERETSEHMADWRASFASLQLKQAHEVAEFALSRRREDEFRMDRQAKEIAELRRAFEASKLETEQVKANCALITEEKLKLEEALANQVQICQTLGDNVSKLSKAKELVSGENLELKRSLDEAVVTTGRLKSSLEEKAAELVAWLGLESIGPLGLSKQFSADELSLEEKKAYSAPSVSSLRSDESQQLVDFLAGEEPFEEVVLENSDKEDVFTFATEKLINALEEQFEEMKHEVLLGIPKRLKSRTSLQEDPSVSLKESSGSELDGGRNAVDIFTSKQKQVVMELKQKIAKSQLGLERPEFEGTFSNEQVNIHGSEHSDIKRNLVQTPTLKEKNDQNSTNCRRSEASQLVNNLESATFAGPGLTSISSSGSCNNADEANDEVSGEDKADSGILDAVAAAFPITDGAGAPSMGLQMAENQSSQSFDAQQHSEGKMGDSLNDLEDKFICVNQNQPWSIESVSQVVEAITEELTKLLRVVMKPPSGITFRDLETRVKAWSNVTSKTLQSRLSLDGAIKEWKDLVVDFMGQSRQGLISVTQRLFECESELALMDNLHSESLTASRTISSLQDEVHRLEAQSFTDNIEREDEVTLLKEELEQARREAADAQGTVMFLRDQLRKTEMELEKLGCAEEQEFMNSCFGFGREEQDDEDRIVRREEEIGRMGKRVEDLMIRLEENERELGELLIISGVDSDAVVSAKIRRIEQRLEDAKASEEVLAAEKAAVAAQVGSLKLRLAEVEDELQIERRRQIDILVQYEEEQGHLEASTWLEAGAADAKLTQMQLQQLLAEKTKQLDLAQGGQDLSASQTQLLVLRARVLTLESNLAVTRQKAVDCEAAIKSQLNEKEKYALLEAKFVTLQREFATLETQLNEMEQCEKRAQINVNKLMVELGIAKEEVLRYEVRLQKTERQAKEDLEIEKRKHEETHGSLKQIEWHLCRQLELTEGLEKEKSKLRDILEEFELQNLALQKESDNLRTAYMQLARQAEQQRGR